MTYTIASFFSGVGGIDLAFEVAGFDIVLQVEINEFCTKVLEKHWPDVARIRDIRDCGSDNTPYADVYAGGFPCQPHSLAGNRKGEADSRNLWPDFRRVIGMARPRVVLLENVPGILTTMGVGIVADLASMGYVGRAGIISAADAGAPHLRERWFCVAYAARTRETTAQRSAIERTGYELGDSEYERFKRGKQDRGRTGATLPSGGPETNSKFEPKLGRNATGLSTRMDGYNIWPAGFGAEQYDWEPPRTCGKIANRRERVEALGNAVVPQVVYPIALAIRERLEAEDRKG